MTERADLLASIATTIKPYRAGEIPAPTADHVDRWVSQFSRSQQLPLLREFNHVIEQSFITKADLIEWLGGLVSDRDLLSGEAPLDFWQKVNFLRVQRDGVSQLAMLKLLGGQLSEKLNLKLEECGRAEGDFMYLDDIMCTGNRVASDLEHWIAKEAPQKARLHVVLAVSHTGAEYFLTSSRLKKAVAASGKKIEFKFWPFLNLENRLRYNADSDVLWPAVLPDDPAVQEYAASGKFPLTLRKVGGKSPLFSTEEGRQVLESEFLLAGMRIRSQITSPKDILRPLGFGQFNVGFGSTLATYRNCPNTCPLAIWWGEGAESGAMQWYPLLPRKTYSSAENVFKAFL